jgi:hypothetical protein
MRAKAAIRYIESAELRQRAIGSLHQASVELDDSDLSDWCVTEACNYVYKVESADSRDRLILRVVRWLTRIGELKRAERLVQILDSSKVSAKARVMLVDAQASAGDWESAEESAMSILSSAERAAALSLIASRALSLGQEDRAERAARAIKDPKSQAEVNSLIARRYIEEGDLKRAERVADLIVDAWEHARALILLSTRSSADDARRLLARALALGGWGASLPELAQLEPTLIDVIAGQLLATEDTA